MTALTTSDIGRAVDAIRELSDVIEKLHKSTWPDEDRNDILRKADLADDQPRAVVDDTVAKLRDGIARQDALLATVQSAMDDIAKRIDSLKNPVTFADVNAAPAYAIAKGAQS
jgi:hypothetical protein